MTCFPERKKKKKKKDLEEFTQEPFSRALWYIATQPNTSTFLFTFQGGFQDTYPTESVGM